MQLVAGGRLQLGVALGSADDEEYGLAGLTRSGQRERTDEFLGILADGVPGARGQGDWAFEPKRLTPGHSAAGATAMGRRDL